ncbi:ash family protein [Ralstonia pickettii]|nr:hypothetical protein [Ralstonia solanacearum]MBU6523554.1 ash family protein [Ralstonia sp. B265]UCA14191.1 ash family protein [Ralstonia pickettii]
MAGLAGQPSGWPVPTFRFANPACARLPHLAMSGGLHS